MIFRSARISAIMLSFLCMQNTNCLSSQQEDSSEIAQAEKKCIAIRTKSNTFKRTSDVTLKMPEELGEIYLVVDRNCQGMRIEKVKDHSEEEASTKSIIVENPIDFIYWGRDNGVLSTAWGTDGSNDNGKDIKIEKGWYRVTIVYTDKLQNKVGVPLKCCAATTNVFYLEEDELLTQSVY